MYVAEVDVTMYERNHYRNIKRIQKIIHEEVLGNDFDLEKLHEVNRHMGILIESLNHWLFYNNPNRYFYDLKSFLHWLREKK